MDSLFITGASGFMGRHLLQKIDPKRYANIYCLSRSRGAVTESLSQYENCQFINGSIYDCKVYAPFLAFCDTVIHLAAATGKVMPEEYFTINAKGTQFLIDQCKQSGVKNFLYISSIAVKFKDKSRYYYAQSKELAEHAVASSGLNYTIVRPTIVIGKDSAVWKNLSKLAKVPITPMFGDGRTKIQPIYIEDLVDCLLLILRENIFSNEIIELGGPEEISFENFLIQIRYMCYGKKSFVVHIPIRQFMTFIAFFEKRFYSILPINVGQLYAFRNDGTIEMNKIFGRQVSRMKKVNEMLKLVISNA